MGIKMKLATFASVAVLAMAAGLTYEVKDSDDNYLLSVTWKPATLAPQNPVDIVGKVDGVQIIGRSKWQSPWHETMTASQGARVSLTAVTRHPSVFSLDCVILVNGKSIPRTGFDSRPDAGNVLCHN